MKFSSKNQSFYANDLSYHNLPDDLVEIDDDKYLLILNAINNGCYVDSHLNVSEPKPTQYHIFQNGEWVDSRTPEEISKQTIAIYTAAVQKRLDNFAQSRGYDNMLSAATYATSTIAKFAAEGRAAVDARDSTWAACYAVLAAVQSGDRDMPTLERLLAELPILAWPNA